MQGSLRRDLVSAYLASGAKVASWVVVSALLYRAGPFYFAMFALVRSTVGLFGFLSTGLRPAVIGLLAEAGQWRPSIENETKSKVLAYESPQANEPFAGVYSSAYMLAFVVSMLCGIPLAAYAWFAHLIHVVPVQINSIFDVITFMGFGVLARFASEPASAVLTTSGRIVSDNVLVVFAELIWVAITLVGYSEPRSILNTSATGFGIAGAILFLLRTFLAEQILPRASGKKRFDPAQMYLLLSVASVTSLAQLSDFLYAPVDFILINRFIGSLALAAYVPAVQIDGGLLLLVSGLAMVLLPRAALLHSSGDWRAVRSYYLRGTVAAAGLLAAASLVVWLLSPWIFRIWLGNPMPATQAILPLVLIHTVIGGSAAIGRTILLATGHAKALAVAVLSAGVGNVVISYVLVRYFDMGLKGIVTGTICAAVALGIVWQPWYVLKKIVAPPVGSDPDHQR